MSFRETKPTENLAEKEQRILTFWQKNKIFDKQVAKNKGKEKWSFLDGPITANNPMGVHHAWGRTYKDLFQRYRAMQGFDERFQNGFDCQGLWVEVEVEKELGFKTKKDIENYGIEKFVNLCKERVLKYSKIQTEQSIRLGQWMDWNNSYYTMSDENNYAIWHFLKECFKKNLLYKGRDSVPWCPRCSTAISQHEILTEEYQEVTHRAIYYRLPIVSENFSKTSLLVWTTTPWTIPANVALAVNPDFCYGIYSNSKEKIVVLKQRAKKILDKDYKLEKEIAGKKLVGLNYIAPFDNLERIIKSQKINPAKFHLVIADKNLVTAEEGTGIVHIAPGAGAEDFQLAKENNMPVIEVIDEQANYLDLMGDFSGKNAKENPEIILDYIKSKDAGKYFYKTEKYTHRYPKCWRCRTELVWRVVDEWYIGMDKISNLKSQISNKSQVQNSKFKTLREKMIEATKKIKWLPSFGLKRELDWLKNMEDWLISKKRYWGLALPIFECPCGNFEVIGSKEELKEKAVDGWEDFEGQSPHRPWIDKIKIKCPKCQKTIFRIPDVGNPWLDAGIVPFSTLKYFKDRNYWQKWFPADFICESFPGQFKNWFYSLIAMSTVLENSNPFRAVLGHALVRDEQGEEMHKSKGNAIWFDEAAEKMGVDAMRWLFVTANPYENLNFGYARAEKIKRRFFLIFLNVYQFFVTYSALDKWQPQKKDLNTQNILDKWIISKLNKLILDVTDNLDKFRPKQSADQIESFIVEDLSTWYLRRSRKRRSDEFYAVMYHVLINVLKLLAPFTPFMAEDIYQNLACRQAGLKTETDPISIHLCDWPRLRPAGRRGYGGQAQTDKVDEELISQMTQIRKLAEMAHSQRAAQNIKVRQPLAKAKVKKDYGKESLKLLADEINVKEILVDKKLKSEIELDTKITVGLQKEGIYREILRLVQDLRKKAGLKPGQKASLNFYAEGAAAEIFKIQKEKIQKETATVLDYFQKDEFLAENQYNINGQKVSLKILKKDSQ